MSDTYLDAFNNAFRMAHETKNAQRLQEAARMQAQLHQMQMLKMASELMQPKPEEFTDWGYGQKRGKTSGEIVPVPTAPKEPPSALKPVYDANGKITSYTLVQPGSAPPEGGSFSPPKEEAKEPAIPLFVDKALPDGSKQKMKYNPKTKEHDIPFGSPAKNTIGTDTTNLTEAAIRQAATTYVITGRMPSLGMRAAAAREAILNMAPTIAAELGAKPDQVPGIQEDFKRVSMALGRIKTAKEQIQVFEKGMMKNMDYALDLSKKYERTGLPPVNMVINALKTKTGDPQIVQFATAIYAAAMEFEKIRTAGTGVTSAELSIGAQKKAEEIINTAHTHEQISSILSAMRTDASNISTSYDEKTKQLSGELRQFNALGLGRESTTPAAPRKHRIIKIGD